MADKLKILMGLSALSSAASLYQIVTHSHQFDRTFLVIYCVLVVIITLILLFVTSFLAR